jgi:hypothetical protein
MDKITRVTTLIRIIHGGHGNIQNAAGPSAPSPLYGREGASRH